MKMRLLLLSLVLTAAAAMSSSCGTTAPSSQTITFTGTLAPGEFHLHPFTADRSGTFNLVSSGVVDLSVTGSSCTTSLFNTPTLLCRELAFIPCQLNVPCQPNIRQMAIAAGQEIGVWAVSKAATTESYTLTVTVK